MLALAGLVAAAPSALADGRRPGGVLVHPIQQAGLFDPGARRHHRDEHRPDGAGETDVHFQYANVDTAGNPFLSADCTIADRVQTLTPADTMSVLATCHDGTSAPRRGSLVDSATDPELVVTSSSFDHLIGSEQMVALGGKATPSTPSRSSRSGRPQPPRTSTPTAAATSTAGSTKAPRTSSPSTTTSAPSRAT
ncbi:MAG: hypothetical protein R3F34_09465 [Planctomycetota bacterium]